MRAKDRNQYLRVTYHAHDDEENQYCETLHSSEIAVCREWLDKVVRVDVFSDAPETLTGRPARDLLEKLTTANLSPSGV